MIQFNCESEVFSMAQVSEYVAAAVCANFWFESGVNPAIWEGTNVGTWTDIGVGYGLGQWTNTQNDPHGRLYQLHEYLSTNDFANDDGDGQLTFLIEEDYWHDSDNLYPMFTSLTDFLESDSTDVTLLTHAYNWCWEGIHDHTWDDRAAQAQQILEYIRVHSNDQNTWIKGNRYLKPSERFNNCIIVFQNLGGHFIGRKGMPVWMMLRPRRFMR